MKKDVTIGYSREIHRIIRNTGSRKPRRSEMIKKSDSSLIHTQHHRLQRWPEHFTKQFSWPITTADFLLMRSSETIQANTSPPSEIDTPKKQDSWMTTSTVSVLL